MTNYTDEDLFHACMNFCESFGIFLMKKEEIENGYRFGRYAGHERREMMRFYKEMLRDNYNHLYVVITAIDKELKKWEKDDD